METYNTLFKLEELVSAITKSTDSAVGPDEIHYQMLKHLPDVTLETLLQIIMTVGSVVPFLHLGVRRSFFLFQKLIKTERTQIVIAQLPLQVVYVKLSNV